MNTKQRLSLILGELGQTLGIDDLDLDDNNTCALSFDDRLVVDIQLDENNGNLILLSSLGEIQSDQERNLYAQMLRANFEWSATEGLTLALEPDSSNAVLFCRESFSDLDQSRFEAVLQQFVNAADHWMAVIASGITTPSTEQDEEQPARLLGIRV